MDQYISHKIYADQLEINFQLIHSPMLDGIITLHHDIFSYLLLIIISMMYLLLRIIILFVYNNNLIWLFAINRIHLGYLLSRDYTIRTDSNYYHGKEVFLELLWTIVPLLILIFIGLQTMSLLYSISDYTYFPNYTICVIAHQWFWEYNYTDFNLQIDSYMIQTDYLDIGDIRLLEVDNRLLLPAQSHIRIFITSDDVIHSWTIPSVGVKLDASPGRMNHCHFFVYSSSILYGQCSELCGVEHSHMPIVIQTMPIYLYKYIIYNLT